MSAPVKLTADQLDDLADALRRLSKARRECGVDIAPYGPIDIAVGGQTLKVSWDVEAEQYVVDDRVGD